MRSLPRWPGEVAAAKEMQVEMVNGLAAIISGIYDDAIAFAQTLSTGDLRGYPLQMAEQGTTAFVSINHRRDVPAGNDENMDRRLGMDVGEGVAHLILVNGRGGNGTLDNFAKETAHRETSVHRDRVSYCALQRSAAHRLQGSATRENSTRCVWPEVNARELNKTTDSYS